MRAILRSLAGLLPAFVLVVSLPAPRASAAPDAVERARSATGFISSQQMPNGSLPAFSPIGSTADAVLAFVVAQRGRSNANDALRYLRRQVEKRNVTGVGLQAKVAMAAIAAGRDVTTFGGVNLVAAIRAAERPNGRFGAGTAVFDDALAVLALRAAKRTPSANAVGWLAGAQCDDGGWQYDEPAGAGDDAHCVDQADPGSDFFASDTNTTSLAVQALAASRALDDAPNDPFVFFSSIRDAQFGGWGYTWGFETTDTNSTALAIQAYAAGERPLPSGALASLKALQYKNCGAFAYSWADDGSGGFERDLPNLGATIGGVPGLLRRPMPIATNPIEKPAPVTPPCP